MAICSNLPGAAGMSTSSAVVCAMYIVLAQANRLESRPEWKRSLATPERLYEYLGTIENGQDFDEVIIFRDKLMLLLWSEPSAVSQGREGCGNVWRV